MKGRFFLKLFFCCLTVAVSGVLDQRAIYADAGQELDDSQIINVMMTVNKGEIAAAQAILKTNASPTVREYANYLLQQHQKSQSELMQLTRQLGLEPKASAISNAVESEGSSDLSGLDNLQKGALDKAYIDAMVREHKGGLKVIETKLFPDAQNPQLKAFVDKFRNMVYSHFEKGLQIQRTLANQPILQ